MSLKKHNILFLSSWYPTRLSPMNGDFVKRHAEAVSLYSHVICFHVIRDKNMNTDYEIFENSDKNLHEIVYYFNRNLFIKLFYIVYYLKGFKYICKKYGKPDIIHGNVLYPIGSIVFLLSFFYKIPYILTEHWTGFLNNTFQQFSRFKKSIYCYVGRKAKYISPVTINLKESMIASGIKGNYVVIPNVFETDIFKIGTNVKQEKKKILHVSHIRDEHKNISGILRTISELTKIRQDFVLNIIHSEENENAIEIAKSLKLLDTYVRFCGKKDYHEVANYMTDSAFLILFSNYENLPCVIVEAFASGLPVISTDVGGIREHLDDKMGILIKKGDEKALLEKMNFMLDHYLDYDKTFLHNYAVKEFSYETIGLEFEKIYKKILND